VYIIDFIWSITISSNEYYNNNNNNIIDGDSDFLILEHSITVVQSIDA